MNLFMAVVLLSGILWIDQVWGFAPCHTKLGCHATSLTSPQALVPSSTNLRGILDEVNSDSFDLFRTSSADDPNSDYEILLGDLVFSTNDPRVDIVNKIDSAGDTAFLDWLQGKIEKSKDPEERIALKDLQEMIIDIKTRLEVNRLAEERASQEAAQAEQSRLAQAEEMAAKGLQMTTADVLKKAKEIQMQIATGMDSSELAANSQSKKQKSFFDAELTPEIRLSYEGLLKKVMPPYMAGQSFASVVYNFYDQFDAQFVKVLSELDRNGDENAKQLLAALATEQRKRMESAAEAVKSVLAQGEPQRMEGAIVKMAREGRIDEPFLLLMEANENQARAAGANGPAELMKRLRERALDEKDKQTSSKEIRLLRQLLRTDDAAKREKLLEEAFTPKESLIVPGTAENARRAVDGEQPESQKPMPEVLPPDFLNACKAVLLNFGNLGDYDENRGDLASRIKKLTAEAEVVATRIFGQGMTVREQQDRMWKEQTTSIFDLERMEIEAERRGESVPWGNPNADDDMLLPGFDAQGRMQIGGS